MKLRETKILWTREPKKLPKGWSPVRVMPISQRETEDELRLYPMSGGAAFGWWQEKAEIDDLLYVILELVSGERINANVIVSVFSQIDEFYDWYRRSYSPWIVERGLGREATNIYPLKAMKG